MMFGASFPFLRLCFSPIYHLHALSQITVYPSSEQQEEKTHPHKPLSQLNRESYPLRMCHIAEISAKNLARQSGFRTGVLDILPCLGQGLRALCTQCIYCFNLIKRMLEYSWINRFPCSVAACKSFPVPCYIHSQLSNQVRHCVSTTAHSFHCMIPYISLDYTSPSATYMKENILQSTAGLPIS